METVQLAPLGAKIGFTPVVLAKGQHRCSVLQDGTIRGDSTGLIVVP
jgi:hypothetical protein